jgi:hypothetical protein
MDSNWSALTSYGIYMTGSGGQDVQITNSTLDRCKIDCVYTSLAGNSIEIRGGWMTAADTGQTAAIELDNAAGTTIADVKFLDNQAVPVIYAHGLNDGTNAILNNRFYLDSTGAQAISANNATALNIVGNSIVGAGHTFTNPVIKFVNQDFSNIKANWLGNGAGTGISFDASSDNNCCSNLNTLITFTTSDAGTGNSFSSGSGLSGMTATQVPIAATASTVTSSKALAGSGAAITTGPSSSTNLNCAQFTGTAGELADSGAPCSGGSAFITSLTTTGSSGAATVSSGVLNVPVYTGGGSTTGGLGAPGAIGSWTWVNQGSDTAANVGTDLVLTMVNDSGLNWRLFTQNVPGSTPWEAKAYLSVGSEASPLAGSGAATDGGIYLYDGTKLLGIEFLWLGSYSTATNYPQLRVERIANVTSDNSTVYNPATTGLSGYLGFQSTGAVWVRWCDDATNLKAYYSMDGSSWTKFYTESVGTWLTPTKAGFGGVNLLTTQTQTRTLKGWTLATVASCLD